MVDSHCHLDDYGPDLPAVFERAAMAGVSTLLAIGIGDGPATMGRALDIAHAYRKALAIFATAGIHPQEAHQADEEALTLLRSLASDSLCLAVGEIGLDYYHAENPTAAIQQAAFVAQMEIAAEVGKPIIIHCRTSELAQTNAKEKFGAADAWADLLRLIEEHWPLSGPGVRGGIMHCFSGGVEEARRSVEAGFYLSFAGNLTYPKSLNIREAATWAPADRILVETDAPFLAPVPHRGKRNEPAWVVHTAAALASLRGVTVEEIASQTTENFTRLFPSTRAHRCVTLSETGVTRHMAADNSFDVVSKVELQEVKNAIDQASKEVHARFDLKDSKSKIELEGTDVIQLASQDEYKLEAVVEILSQKLVKRGVSLKNLEFEKIEPASNSSVRQKIKLVQGIPSEKAKIIVAAIKDSKKKAQASIQGDTVRVVSKDRDVLQDVMALLRAKDIGVELQFTNFRSN